MIPICLLDGQLVPEIDLQLPCDGNPRVPYVDGGHFDVEVDEKTRRCSANAREDSGHYGVPACVVEGVNHLR